MNTPQIKFCIHEITAEDLGKKGFANEQVGDLVIYALSFEDEKITAIRFDKLEGHKVSAEEAGTGIFAKAQAGDLGIIGFDGLFYTADELSDAVSQEQVAEGAELCEIDDTMLDDVVGGFKWSTGKFFRSVAAAMVRGGSSVVKIASTISDIATSGLDSVVDPEILAKGKDMTSKDALTVLRKFYLF